MPKFWPILSQNIYIIGQIGKILIFLANYYKDFAQYLPNYYIFD